MAGRSGGPRAIRPLRDFLDTEAAGGVLLVTAAAVALAWANSPWKSSYHRLWATRVVVRLGSHELAWNLAHWVNDGLMTLFFFLVGLEIKRELTSGHLAERRAALLPALAAVGGMVTPALIYLAIAGGTDHRHAWGIPMATDIALAIGVASLLGARVPSGLRTFLLALAIVDDIGAIVVIAVLYSNGVRLAYLGMSVAAVAVAAGLRRLRVQYVWVYVIVGVVGWYALYRAGVHPTLIGVAFGLLAPSVPHVPQELVDVEELVDVSSAAAAGTTVTLARQSVSVVEWLEYRLHGWVSFVVMPVFALANVGVALGGHPLHEAVTSRLGLGIIVGLVVGKIVGIVAVSLLVVRLGWSRLPDGSTMRSLCGVAALAGIGFTVALFVAELAVKTTAVPGAEGTGNGALGTAKLAILLGSLLAAVVGSAILMTGRRPVASSPSAAVPELQGREVAGA